MGNQEFAEEHYKRGCMLFELRRHKEAEGEFKEGLSLDPTNFNCLYAFSVMLMNRGAYKESETAIESLIRHYPDNHNGYLQQAKAYLYQERRDESFQSIQTALQLEPEDEECSLLLGKIEMERNHIPQAYEALKVSLSINPANVEGLAFKLRLLTYKLKNAEEAEETIQLLLKLGPNEAFVHYGVAKYYSSVNKAEISLRHYYKALQLEPGKKLYKQEYTDLLTEYKIGQKGSTQMFGIETNGFDTLVLLVCFLSSIGAMLAFVFLTGIGDRKVTIWDAAWIIGIFVTFLFVLPCALMFLYLKYARKKNPHNNPFKRSLHPDIVDDPFLKVSFLQFFIINNYWNTKVILGSILGTGLLIGFFALLWKWKVINPSTSGALMSLSTLSIILSMRLLKFREE